MTRPTEPTGSSQGSRASGSTPRSLLERARAGEGDAWERLVGLYAPVAYQWCRGLGLQEPDAADVLQEVFQAVAVHLGDFRRARPSDTFRGWLRTITRNKVNDHYRRLAREPGGAGGSEAQERFAQVPDLRDIDIEPAIDDPERGLFRNALDLIRIEFEDRTWQAFWRTVVDGRLARDVATELGMSPGAVRVAKYRVLRRFREELGDLGE